MTLRTTMLLALIVVALLITWGLYRRHKLIDSKLDLDDLLLGEDGKLSKAAAVMMGAFGVTSWLVVYLALQGKMTEGYLAGYLAAWVAPTVTRLITNRPSVTQDKAGA